MRRLIPAIGILAVVTALISCGGSSTAVQPLVDLPTLAPVLAGSTTEPTADAPSPTPLAVEESSADPTAEPTANPESTDKPEPKPLGVKITSVTKTRLPGQVAKVAIGTKKGARCSIDVEYASGRSTAKGLGDKTAASNGKVSWLWTVGRSTNPQKVGVSIECTLSGRVGGASTTITVK